MLDDIWWLLALIILPSVIVSTLMVKETLKLIKENKRKKNEYE